MPRIASKCVGRTVHFTLVEKSCRCPKTSSKLRALAVNQMPFVTAEIPARRDEDASRLVAAFGRNQRYPTDAHAAQKNALCANEF
jgi:hypothetical protein